MLGDFFNLRQICRRFHVQQIRPFALAHVGDACRDHRPLRFGQVPPAQVPRYDEGQRILARVFAAGRIDAQLDACPLAVFAVDYSTLIEPDRLLYPVGGNVVAQRFILLPGHGWEQIGQRMDFEQGACGDGLSAVEAAPAYLGWRLQVGVEQFRGNQPRIDQGIGQRIDGSGGAHSQPRQYP
ncbi:MAG: hypothetical protein P8011_01555 [Acidihalobacter sp.]